MSYMKIRHGRKQLNNDVHCINDVSCLWNENELFLNIYFGFKNSRFYGRKGCPLGAYKHSFYVDDDKRSSLCNVSKVELEMKLLTYILRTWHCGAWSGLSPNHESHMKSPLNPGLWSEKPPSTYLSYGRLKYICVGFEVLTAMVTKTSNFWDYNAV